LRFAKHQSLYIAPLPSDEPEHAPRPAFLPVPVGRSIA
jgi:hypothetical protein